MKKLFLVILVGFYASSFSQIDAKFYGDSKDFIELAKRPLLVEIVQENPKTLKKLSSDKKKEELKAYRDFIASYNTQMKIMINKYWTMNTKIDFKTTEEIADIRKAKSKDYALLCYFEFGDLGDNFSNRLTIPALGYTRIEADKEDSNIYLPRKKTLDSYTEADYKLALKGLQDDLNWIIKSGKNKKFNEYAEIIAKENCVNLKNKTLLVPKDLIWKDKFDECKANYSGKLEFVSKEEVDKAYVENRKDTAVLISIPYAIISGGVGPIGMRSLVFFKVIVDCQTNEILYCYNPGKTGFGKHLLPEVVSSDFKEIDKCKM